MKGSDNRLSSLCALLLWLGMAVNNAFRKENQEAFRQCQNQYLNVFVLLKIQVNQNNA